MTHYRVLNPDRYTYVTETSVVYQVNAMNLDEFELGIGFPFERHWFETDVATEHHGPREGGESTQDGVAHRLMGIK